MGAVSSGLAKVIPWLVENGIGNPSEITQEVLDRFLERLPLMLSKGKEEDSRGGLGGNPAIVAITIFYYIWRQRRQLQRLGIQPMPTRPWPNLNGAVAVAKKAFDHEYGWIEPIPDEVAAPLFNAAFRFVEEYSGDILRFRDLCDAAYAEPTKERRKSTPPSGSARKASQKRVAAKHRFSQFAELNDFWNQPRSQSSLRSSSYMLPLKQLLVHLQAACCLVLQGMTGMRVSELCELSAGIDDTTSLPVGVEKYVSRTGLNEEFILTGKIIKAQGHPRPVPWLLGSRLIGDPDLPIGVIALRVLNQLLAPYQRMIDTKFLLVTIVSKMGTPKSKAGVGRITSPRIAKIYEQFSANWIDWNAVPKQSKYARRPDDLQPWKASRGGILTTHMLRKSFASYVLNVAPELLPAVKRQFHHINMQITENNYWGSDAAQIEPIQSVSRQATARLIYERLQGQGKLAGRMGLQIEKELSALRAMIGGLDDEEAWLKINSWVEAKGLDANHSKHGCCIPIAASRMDCWSRAGLRPIGHTEPNYESRTASVCSGCACFVVHKAHIPYWQGIFIDSSIAVIRAEKVADSVQDFREIRHRAKQAKAILVHLGADVSALEEVIRIRSDEEAAST